MAVYLGDSGFVELKRDTLGDELITQLDPADVNEDRRRFSVDFAAGSLITGDAVEIATLDGSDLQLVAGHHYPDGRWYVHVDPAGGLRLYKSFEASLTGLMETALPLETPAVAKQVSLRTRNGRFRPIGRIREFELTTSRETVDVTLLGKEFRQHYEAGLISGQGSMTTLWEHSYSLCDPAYSSNAPEFPVYLARLVLRIQQGADFLGRFFIHHDAADVVGASSVWYEGDCIVTNVAVTVRPTEVIETRVEFVTSGTVALHLGRPPSYLLQEDGERILQESGDGLLLEWET
jgi:hypothetical protein